MSRTEALRIQLDNLQLEMQQLEVENAKLREENTEEAALIEAVRRQDQLKEENLQLKAVYDQLLLDSQADQRALEELQAREEELRGLSQIIFPTVSVIMTLRGGGGSEGVTLIFYLKHTLTFVIILQPSDVNFNHFQLHAQKLTLKFLARFHKNCTHASEG